MRPIIRTLTRTGTLALALGGLLTGCATGGAAAAGADDEGRMVAKNLETFDDLDFNVYSNQKWTELHRSHAADITVHMPDGRIVKGIDKHIEDLKQIFVWAPDTRIKQHPVKVAQKDWTAVIGVMEGTFTKPMPIGPDQAIPPTGKGYKIQMSTFGHWKDGVMDEEYLFWDNMEFMKEIGLGK